MLIWKPGTNGGNAFRWEDDNGLAIIHVVQIQLGPKAVDQWRNGLWEIIFNLCYLSRDKKAYFTSAEKAMEAAEVVLQGFCEKWRKHD